MTICVCERPTDAFVCAACLAQYRAHLSKLPWLLGQLELVASKRVRYARALGYGGDQFPLPLNLDATHHTHLVRNHLTTTARMLADGFSGVDPPQTTTGLIAWLSAHSEAIALRPFAPDVVTELAELHERGTRLIDRPPETNYVGECACGLALNAEIGAAWHRCACGEQINVAERLAERIHRARETALSITDIHTLSGIPRRTLRAWVKRRRMLSAGTIEGQPIYRYGDALDLRDDRRTATRR